MIKQVAGQTREVCGARRFLLNSLIRRTLYVGPKVVPRRERGRPAVQSNPTAKPAIYSVNLLPPRCRLTRESSLARSCGFKSSTVETTPTRCRPDFRYGAIPEGLADHDRANLRPDSRASQLKLRLLAAAGNRRLHSRTGQRVYWRCFNPCLGTQPRGGLPPEIHGSRWPGARRQAAASSFRLDLDGRWNGWPYVA